MMQSRKEHSYSSQDSPKEHNYHIVPYKQFGTFWQICPITPPNFGDLGYWDQRYAKNDTSFEWYQTWYDIIPIVAQFFDGTEKCINIGCGNSDMTAQMTETFSFVVGIDYSKVVIDQMKRRHQDNPKAAFVVMDCMHMDYEDGSFGAAFDKGTIDAILCNEAGYLDAIRVLREVYRVIKPGGFFIEITYAPLELRMKLFRDASLSWLLLKPIRIQSKTKQGKFNYMYVFNKPDPSQIQLQ